MSYNSAASKEFEFYELLNQTPYTKRVRNEIESSSPRQLSRRTQTTYQQAIPSIGRVNSEYARTLPHRLTGKDVGINISEEATKRKNKTNTKYKTSQKSPLRLQKIRKLIATFGAAAILFGASVAGINAIGNHIEYARDSEIVASSTVENLEQNGFKLEISPRVLEEYMQIKSEWEQLKNSTSIPTTDEVLSIYDRLDEMGNSLLANKISQEFENDKKFSFVSCEPEYNHTLNTNPNNPPVSEYRIFLTLHNKKSDTDKKYLVDDLGPVLTNYIKAEEAIDKGRSSLYGLSSTEKNFRDRTSIAEDAITLLDETIFPAYDNMAIHNYEFDKDFFNISNGFKESNPDKIETTKNVEDEER